MNPKEQGLTVGELTMAIGLLILIALIWSTFNGKKDSKNTNLILNQRLSNTIVLARDNMQTKSLSF